MDPLDRPEQTRLRALEHDEPNRDLNRKQTRAAQARIRTIKKKLAKLKAAQARTEAKINDQLSGL